MSGINWSDFGKNIEPELKIFSKNIFPTRNWSDFDRNNGSGSELNVFPTRNYQDWRQPYNNGNKSFGHNYRSKPVAFGQQSYNNRPKSDRFDQQNYKKTEYRPEPVAFGQTKDRTVKDFNDHNTVNNTANVPDTTIKNSEEKSVEVPKKITNALLKLDKVSNTINDFMEDFLSDSGITNNTEYLDLWKSSGNQEKLFAYIKQKKIKMKETIEERNAKKMEKKIKRETKLKDIHQKRMDKQQSKPKTAFYYFKEDETIKLKLEHPSWNRKEVHAELQKKWKAIKNTDEARPYREKTKSNEDTSA